MLRIKDKTKLKRFAHIAAAVSILIHAYENYETGHHSFVLFTIAGLIVLAMAVFHHAIEKRAHWIDGVFFFIEAILSFVVSYDLFHHEKKALQYVYLALGIFQVFMAFKKGKKGIDEHKIKPAEIPKESK